MNSWQQALRAASAKAGRPKAEREAPAADANVVLDGIVEQVDVLKDDREVCKQAVTGDVANVHPADRDPTLAHIPESGYQVAERGLSRA